ncbi:unnamed protein product [Mytilus coruscus]|uniref:Uncharacterized protein n=1 Tax=Mytilus coruscus TaxID=42192 RepID=A0A6J8A4Z1_MYTCO|nr:unnamed protein product [Mytilus coruscus]
MSQRTSKSPYASKKRLRSSAQPSKQAYVSESQQSDEVIYQRVQQRDVTTQLGSRSSNIVGQHTSMQVSAQMTPEIRNEVIQTVNALINSPATVTSPNSVNERQQWNTGITQSSNILPVISLNDNLVLNVSPQTQDKIINGEYVDLDTNGQLFIQTKPSKKITDINTWIDAFLIYTSMYVGVNLEDTQNILKYMYSVKLGASRSIGLGWKDYDQQFRLKKARNPAISWAIDDQELWLLYIQCSQIHLVLGKKVTPKALQSLVGLLNFCAKAIPAVRAFNRRFCDAMCGVVKPENFIRVTVSMKEDIHMWLTFLDLFNGSCKFGKNVWLTNEQLNLFTDSTGNSKLGCGRSITNTNTTRFSEADIDDEINKLVDSSV